MNNIDLITPNKGLICKFITEHDVLIRICGSKEDAYQECCCRIMKKSHLYDEKRSKQSTFIMCCLDSGYKHLLKKYYGKTNQKYNTGISLDEYIDNEDDKIEPRFDGLEYIEHYEDQIMTKDIYNACSEVMKMYAKGFKIREISEKIGVSKQAISLRLIREKNRLLKRFGRELNEILQ